MRYDPQSAFIFTRTDWAALGAVHLPPEGVPRFGMPLTVWESNALGSARRGAEGSRLGSGSETFAQPHPQHEERGIILICTAWCHRDGGWSIGLVEPDGRDSDWVLKADMEAQLRCACHCDWRRDCPGVVSGTAPMPRGPMPSPSPRPSPVPSPQPIAPQQLSAREARRAAKRERVLTGWFGQPPQAARQETVAAPQTAAIVYADPDPWREQPAEEYRGSIYGQSEPVYAEALATPPEWLTHLTEATAEPEPVRAERRGIISSLFSRREPPPAEEYRGAIHATPEPYHASGYLSAATDQADYATDAPIYAPEALTYAPDWPSEPPEPEAVPLARAERRVFFSGMFASREAPAPAIEAPQQFVALDYARQPEADFSPSYDAPQIAEAGDYDYAQPSDYQYADALPSPASDAPQLPPPSSYDDQLSSQSEIDSFIEAANAYATPEPQPEPERLALPAPGEPA